MFGHLASHNLNPCQRSNSPSSHYPTSTRSCDTPLSRDTPLRSKSCPSQGVQLATPLATPSTRLASDSKERGIQEEHCAQPFLPPFEKPKLFSQNEAFEHVADWFAKDRPGPFLSVHCAPDIFLATSKQLAAKGILPPFAHDYNPRTQIWHIRGRPHILHELGSSVLRSIENIVVPSLNSSPRLGRLAPLISWNSKSPRCELGKKLGCKEPDASLFLSDRVLPTVVFEVGFTESRRKLRSDAARWLHTGNPEEADRKRKRDDNSLLMVRPIMLVVLVSFEGKRPADDTDIHYDDADYDEETPPSTPKPLKIYVEMWRLQSAPEARQLTRANSPQHLMVPTMCERKQFYSPQDGDNRRFVTVYAEDIFGTDHVSDPRRLVKWKIPLEKFREGYEDNLGIFRRKQMENDGTADDPEIVELGEEDIIAEQDGLGGEDDLDRESRVELVVVHEEETGGQKRTKSQ